SKDGKVLAGGGATRAVQLFDPQTAERLLREPLPSGASHSPFALAHDGRRVFVRRPVGDFAEHDTATGKQLRHFGKLDPSRFFLLSPDGKTLVSESGEFGLRFWDLASGKERCRTGPFLFTARCAAYAPDGKRVAVGGSDGCIRL